MSALQKLLLVGACALIATGLGMKWEASHSPLLPRRLASATSAASTQEAPALYEFQVTKPVLAMPGNPAPRYPNILQSARIGGNVLVQFVVDTNGRAEMSTFKAIKSSDERFTDAVRDVLPLCRFSAAEADGHRVRQYVQQPFTFDPAFR